MGSEWPTIPLSECTTDGNISYGVVQPGKDLADGIPIIRVNNFSDGQLVGLDSAMRIDPSIAEKHKKTSLQGGEVLLTLVGSTGQTSIVSDSLKGWNVARAVAVIRPKKEIGSTWIDIFLNSNGSKHFLDSRANTTVQKTLNLKDVKDIPISIPPENIKSYIESIYSSLNDKIELNRKMNETLEAMAQALFKSWFVDFDPVIDNALAAGNEIPEELREKAEIRRLKAEEKNSSFIPHNSSFHHLFPNEFELTEEMGWTPKGWEVKSLGEEVNFWNGKKNDRAEKGLYPLYGANGVIGLSNEYRYERALIIGRVGAYCGSVKYEFNEFWGSDNTIIAKMKGTESLVYLYFLLTEFDLNNHAEGAAHPLLTQSLIKQLQHVSPSKDLISQYESLALKNFVKMDANIKIVETLSMTRETLLPKLLSGDLNLDSIELELEGVK